MKRIGYRYQRTIQRTAEVSGTGFLTGRNVRLRFRPAAAHAGILLVRTDLKGAPGIPALVAHVTGTNRRTILGRPPFQIEMVEHVLAALAGLRIDNCVIEVNAPEPPGLDGSAQAFVNALNRAGIALQAGRREVWATEEPVRVSQGAASLTLHPGPENCLRVSYFLDYGLFAAIDRQRHTVDITPETCCNGLMASRTFLLEPEAEALRRQGLGERISYRDLLVFGPRGPIENRLRRADEPARHKILDIVGDLTLLGCDLRGHVIGDRSGHALTVELVRKLLQAMSARSQPRYAAAA